MTHTNEERLEATTQVGSHLLRQMVKELVRQMHREEVQYVMWLMDARAQDIHTQAAPACKAYLAATLLHDAATTKLPPPEPDKLAE
jgi:hypothetical protein